MLPVIVAGARLAGGALLKAVAKKATKKGVTSIASGVAKSAVKSAKTTGSKVAASNTAKMASKVGSSLAKAAKTTPGQVAIGAAATGGAYAINKAINNSGSQESNSQQDSPEEYEAVNGLTGEERKKGMSKREYKEEYGVDWDDTPAGKSKKAQEKAEEEAERAASEARRKAIKGAYNDVDDEADRVNDLIEDDEEEYTPKLKALLSQYGSAVDEKEQKDLSSVQNQRELLRKDQHSELNGIADSARKKQFSVNTELGTTGSADSSAAGMASRAIQKATNASRKDILSQVSVQVAELNQKKTEIQERAKSEREGIYRMEREQKTALKEAFEERRKALKSLKNTAKEWEKADIEREEASLLANYENGIAQIEQAAQSDRTQLHNTVSQLEQDIDDKKLEAVLTFAPPELEAEEIEDIDLETGEEVDDYFNPDAPKRERIAKKKVKSVIEDEEDDEK